MDITTLDTAASQTEYDVSLTWKRVKPFKIEIQGRTGDSNDNQWIPTEDWYYRPAVAGTVAKIIFNFQPIASRDIAVWYKGVHGLLNAFSDPVNEGIDPELAAIVGTLKAAEFANSRSQGTDVFLLQKINKLENKLAMRKIDTPTPRHNKRSKILVVGDGSAGLDRFTYPLAP